MPSGSVMIATIEADYALKLGKLAASTLRQTYKYLERELGIERN